MKRFLYLLSLLLCVSCGDDDSTLAYISLDSSEITFEQSGGSVNIKLQTDGKWQADNIPTWISFSHTNGDTSTEITVTASSNESTELRNIEIYFLRDNQKALLKIHQLGKEKELSWSPLSFSSFDNVSFVSDENSNERIYNFSTRELFINPDADTDIKENIFLGNLIDRRLENNTDVSVYSGYTFNPITVFPSVGVEKPQTFIPSKLAQDSYAEQIIANKPSQNEAFLSDGKGVIYNSHRELSLIGAGNMGVKLDEVISEKSYQEQEMIKKNGLIYSFSQTLFSLNMDLQEHLVTEELIKEDFPANSISYISSVSYGRIGLLIVESDNDVEKIRVIVNKVLQANTEGFTQEESIILDELTAYHLYYDKSQKLKLTKGKLDVIKAYKAQITNDSYTVFPFKFRISDYFEQGDTNMDFTLTIP